MLGRLLTRSRVSDRDVIARDCSKRVCVFHNGSDKELMGVRLMTLARELWLLINETRY